MGKYPFVPKSSISLTPGDFWAVPLSDGSFACGRVMEHMPKGMPGARVAFLGALLDWHDITPPNSESIAGAKPLRHGLMHILAITSTGGSVLGNRSLAQDGIDSWQFVHDDKIHRGFAHVVRPWRVEDSGSIPPLSWWGYDVIQLVANKQWSGDAQQAVAADRRKKGAD